MVNVTREQDCFYSSRNGSMKSSAADISLYGIAHSNRKKGIISNVLLLHSIPYECETHSAKKLPRGFLSFRRAKTIHKASLQSSHFTLPSVPASSTSQP